MQRPPFSYKVMSPSMGLACGAGGSGLPAKASKSRSNSMKNYFAVALSRARGVSHSKAASHSSILRRTSAPHFQSLWRHPNSRSTVGWGGYSCCHRLEARLVLLGLAGQGTTRNMPRRWSTKRSQGCWSASAHWSPAIAGAASAHQWQGIIPFQSGFLWCTRNPCKRTQPSYALIPAVLFFPLIPCPSPPPPGGLDPTFSK